MAAMTDSQANHEDITVLHDRLDGLWTQYLQLLDDYTAAQASIQKHLAAGYFSLTQANFQSAGKRYGRDSYDDRAVALTRVEVTDGGKVTIEKAEESRREEGDVERRQNRNGAEAVQQMPSPSPTPEPESKTATAKSSASADNDAASEETSADSITLKEPLRWFGILIPQSLRSAQKSFSSTVLDQDGVAKAVNAACGMRDVEAEVRKLRKAIKRAGRGSSA